MRERVVVVVVGCVGGLVSPLPPPPIYLFLCQNCGFLLIPFVPIKLVT